MTLRQVTDLPGGIILEITVLVKLGWRLHLRDPERPIQRRIVVAHRARFKDATINSVGQDDNTIPILLRWEQASPCDGPTQFRLEE